MQVKPILTNHGQHLRTSTSQESSMASLHRYSPLSNEDEILIIIVILLPIALIVILCAIAYCWYQFRRKSSRRPVIGLSVRRLVDEPMHSFSPIVIVSNQLNPSLTEDAPPSYEVISKIKKLEQNSGSACSAIPIATISSLPPSYAEFIESTRT